MSLRRTLGAALLAATLSLTAGVAVPLAADPAAIVSQKGRHFTPKEIEVKRGDMVRFVNDDFYGHNVYSETEGAGFDIGLQAPGEERDVVLEKLGIVDVRCRIHPRMRLKITVTE
ncbi:plastocyanin/azurin family copper-binding protein [Nisaea acidiphila]|uniref:Plastocyanin/azurin family copper-binding protein n=1 Tax=Nisaea acidiphila TaxID=1862145 RepID=A0A9J7AXQ2_9PROT|nr:plastocyanin/azurin family copper-binding protein [Nisaea acidiphila]UUX51217.1 plastocyanin/azurin family copper-binding protein [Nisaea acidiphila]